MRLFSSSKDRIGEAWDDLSEKFEESEIEKAKVVIAGKIQRNPVLLAWYGGTQVNILDHTFTEIDVFNHTALGDMLNEIHKRRKTDDDLLLLAVKVMREHLDEEDEEMGEDEDDDE